MSILDKLFDLKSRGTTVSTELRGAVATFLTMSYILVANPSILKAAGINFESAIACTAAAAGICCILMGFFANFPMALASGMGLNAVVAFQVAKTTGSWQTAMGLVVLDGLLVLVLVILGLRESVMAAIPKDLRIAIGVGIGMFIAFLGLLNAKLVVGPGTANPPVTYGSLANPQAAIALIGLLITSFLLAKRIKGAIVLGIVISTVLALIMGVTKIPTSIHMPSFDIAFKADIRGAFLLKYVPLLLSVVMVDFFDTLGTVTAIADEAGLEDENGKIPGLRNILMVDSISASIGGLFGASSVTSYVESAAGVAEGARTGLSSVFVGILFLFSILVAPFAAMIPGAATAPALILVGFLMTTQITKIDFKNLYSSIPAFVTIITIPLTYSVSHGIGYGFITYVVMKVCSGKFREVHLLMYIVSLAFAAYFILGK